MIREAAIQIWGGMECTINRVGNQYFDQSEYAGHYERGAADIDLIHSLGIRTLRYPVLWERQQPQRGGTLSFGVARQCLGRMQELGIEPIVGLVHHGSGPAWVNFFDGSFEEGLAPYARQVAEAFPWVNHYTPVNEPLTTARFCGLYGHWYPHGRDERTFFRVLLSECKATVLAMRAIREVNPAAKLVQTEDLGKCHSTPLLAYQAEMENERRWLSYELLCGKLTKDKLYYNIILRSGIPETELQWFLDNPCTPDIAGFNYYLTSERFLDEDCDKYPREYHGGNGHHRYADIHTVHVPMQGRACGPSQLLKEAWERLRLPLAITECHLHSTREDQIRWFHSMWETVQQVRSEGVDIRAITAWGIFGLFGWNKLVTEPWGTYEPGVFNLSSGTPRPTALAHLLRSLTSQAACDHPVLAGEGWWERHDRLLYGARKVVRMRRRTQRSCRPLLVLGKTGTLGSAFGKLCAARHIHCILLGREDIDLTQPGPIGKVLDELNPWAVVNAAGYVNVDGAESDEERCLQVNAEGPALLAAACAERGIRFLSYSSDLVFDGRKRTPYTEADTVRPLNAYGRSKALSEERILAADPAALVLRTSSFFGPWDAYNFVHATLRDLEAGKLVQAASDVVVSPTYVPDLVHTSLDLLLDHDSGIYHVTNDGQVSWADLARQVALLAGYDEALVEGVRVNTLHLPARRPLFSALQSSRGLALPSWTDALERCLEAMGLPYQSSKIAV
ncbi:family 1 glycosylhydrolase [Flaviaesturariibacter amylovorans]|uniref:dTDP-4-dehydrorhamnose reductase n=1 Tax=Flaviaesturariibacter amylovorans TaxID=1084520 RepID=A0ABP8HSS7_9BACT